MVAFDILKKLNGISVDSLSPLQRALFVTDGTLTEILEAYFLEPIRLVKLFQSVVLASNKCLDLLPENEEEQFLERKILLQGNASDRTYVYAESIIAFERLNNLLRDDLFHSDIPLGRLWLNHRLETFKELIDAATRPANDLGHYFGCNKSSIILTRTYRVITANKPIILISETFPTSI